MRVIWERQDNYRDMTAFMMTGMAGALLLAKFGLPPVDFHSPLHYAGVMDPLCGMTRAVRLLALGEVRPAITYNPASLMLAGAAAIFLPRALIGALFGRWARLVIGQRRLIGTVLTVAVVGLWINQQSHAELLMHVGVE